MITNITKDAWYFSSQLDSVTGFWNDSKQVTLQILAFQNYRTPIFSTLLYTANNYYTLHDVRGIVEDYLLQQGRSYATITFAEYNGKQYVGTAEIHVIYYSERMEMDGNVFIASHFLTTGSTRAIYRGQSLSLTAITTDDITISFNLLAIADGRYQHVTWTERCTPTTLDTREQSFIVTWQTIKEKAGTHRPLVLTITAGSIRHTVYCIDRQPDLVLTFRNKFNAIETKALFGTTKRKQEMEREIASVGNARRFYDPVPKTSFLFETTALRYADTLTIPTIITSPDVRTQENEQLLITDFECETTNTDDEPQHISFTYEYSADRPLTTGYTPTTQTYIFTQEYDDTFA